MAHVWLPPRLRELLAGYPELVWVLLAAVVGLSARTPLGWLAGHQGINVLLVVLVLATAVTIDPAAAGRLRAAWRRVALAVLAGITVLPALSWSVAWLVPSGTLRDGVLTVGLAPCEIASVATTALAGGEPAAAAGVLIGSTFATVALAGPVLTLEVGRAGFSPGGIIANLALVVALPLAVGLALRAWARTARAPAAARVLDTERGAAAATRLAMAAVAGLVALVAAEVRLSVAYLAVAAALVLFLIGSALLGQALGARFPRGARFARGDGVQRGARAALLLTTSMRDFAIAAGVATAAFGAAAAAPLGLYGIGVLIWGTACAGLLRKRADGALAEEHADGLPRVR
jgi:predicted Na+-dependent transporter